MRTQAITPGNIIPVYQFAQIKNISTDLEFISPLAQKSEVDTVCITNPINEINSILGDKYGIKSELKNPEIGKRVLKVVEDFVKVNKNNDLFKNLTIKENALEEDVYINWSSNYNTKEFILTFNEDYDWEDFENMTKRMYNKAQIPSDNPNCLLYENFGRFLNFRYNPYAYTYTTSQKYLDDSALNALRISDMVRVADFNASYIAGKMSGKNYPKILKIMFKEKGGNVKLKFPEPEKQNYVQGSVHNFKSELEGAQYLYDKYGIASRFINKKQANLFAGAVDDMAKLTGKTDIFKGLIVEIAPEKYDDCSIMMTTHCNSKTGKAEIWINPAYGWKRHKKITFEQYQLGYHPTPNPKDAYIHELSHYIDFKGNPVEYVKRDQKFKNGELYFTDSGKSKAAKVSEYAAKSDAEFNAEYICGRLNGIKYPEATNKMFKETWLGPTLNFEK